MPFPGGDADKVGNRYEALWTVNCLLQILHGEAGSIHIEQIGDEWDGVEFTLQKSAITEFHQVKRQNSNKGHWPLATLSSKKVLSNAYHLHRIYPSSDFIFVSTDNVAQLHELTERARKLATFGLFQKEGLKANDHRPAFEQTCKYLDIDEPSECYDFLKSFKVEVIGESALNELVRARTAGMITGSTNAVVSLLRSYSENHLQTEITAPLLWKHLASEGFSPVRWSSDPNVIVHINEGNNSYANTKGNYLINNREILRDETNEAICSAVRGDKKFVAVVGAAGSGKSITMQQSFRYLSECGDIVFGFRIDRLEPKQQPKEVGHSLGLPESPVHVLAHIAGDSPCTLFIDQLDAVSLTSGRNPQFFECIRDIFMQAEQYPNMKLVVGCRKFDLDNDHRFRQFFAKDKSATVIVANLSANEVEHELTAAGIPAIQLNAKQKTMLQQPLLLGVFVQIASDEGAFNFSHEGDLFRIKERYSKDELRTRDPGKNVHWPQVMGKLSRYMSQHQILSAPERVVTDYDIDARMMASSGILLYENSRYSFFHESFFDYVFANSFLDSGESICHLLLSAEQHLFRRGQVRQILALQRSEDFDTYLANIGDLLLHEQVRLHIKVSVLEWMRELDNPTLKELRLLLTLTEDQSTVQFRQVIWNCLAGRSAWFALLDQESVINQWLNHENKQWVDHGIWYLRTVQKEQADRITDLLLPLYQQDKEAWQQRLLFVMQWADLGASRKFFEFFLLLLTDGVLDEAKGPIAINADFFALARSLPKSRPEWIGELLEAYIRRQIALYPIDPEKLYKLEKGRDGSVKRLIDAAANQSPEAFVETFFPLVVELIEATQVREKSPNCITDGFWGVYLNESFRYHMHTHIIKGVQTAIENLAKQDSITFQQFFQTWRNSPYHTVQYLLVAGLVHADGQFANDSIDYLVEQDCRLDMGDGHGWQSRQLIEAVTLHCNEEKLLLLEERLLNFYGNPVSWTSWEGKKMVYSHFGYDQFTLLTGVQEARQSHAIKMRIKEWQRKFLCELPAKPWPGFSSGAVRSPISSDGVKYMTDEQWLNAMAQYDSDDHDHEEFLKGGSVQLAQALEQRVFQEPERFAKLLLMLPEDVNRSYFTNIIMGLYPFNGRKVEHIDVSLFERCVHRVFNLPDKPCGRWLPRLITYYKHLALSDDILNILLWFAQNSPDPDLESSTISGNQNFVEDLAAKSINSERGVAVEAIAEMIFENERHYHFFKAHLSLLCRSELNSAVRSEMAYFIIAVSQYDENYAFELFDILTVGQPEEFLAARHVDGYIHHAIFDDLERILPTIQKMLASQHDFVQQAGARHACVAGLISENHGDLIQQCLQGSIAHRKGAAEVFSTNITSDLHSQQSMEFLLILFEDDAEEVRQEAAYCFSQLKKEGLLPYRSFISSFITSRALESNSSKITYLLENSIDQLPDTVLQLIESFLDREGKASGDISTAASGDSYHLNELLIRLYAQTNSSEIKSSCLDAIDRMVSFGSSGLDSELSQFDR